jgi:phage-related minor tail protein
LLKRQQEQAKLKALRKSIEASKKHLEQLEKDHAELEASTNGKK